MYLLIFVDFYSLFKDYRLVVISTFG